MLHLASPPGIYLLSTPNNQLLMSLQRLHDDQIHIWGSLDIFPLNYLELPYHTSEELLSISCLKIWGNTQEPHNDMDYLLVCTGEASGAESYSIALVWISPHQV